MHPSRRKAKTSGCTPLRFLLCGTALFVILLWKTNVYMYQAIKRDANQEDVQQPLQPKQQQNHIQQEQPQKEQQPAVVDNAKRNEYHWKPVELLDNNGATVPLIKSNSTVVTAYFELPSKFTSDKYLSWMSNMLSLQDAMVVFTSAKYVDKIREFRSHAWNRTVIVEMDISQVALANQYSTEFWQHELEIDPEKRIHQSYQLFWVWLSKSWFVTQAIEHNPYESEIFVWSDIGCFRNGKYNGKQMVQHPEILSKTAMLQMAHHAPNPPPTVWWNNKLRQRQFFYHSGSQAAGYKQVWIEFHKRFLETMEGFIQHQLFIGEDQTVLQSTCLQHPQLCEYISFDQVRQDNHYFGLRYALHHGGDYNKWKPPATTTKRRR